SDYAQRLRDWLGNRDEPLLETRARGLLFNWSIYGDVSSAAPLVQTYANHVARELDGIDADACADQLRDLERPAFPPPPACGSALDVSLALRAARADVITLQRLALSG